MSNSTIFNTKEELDKYTLAFSDRFTQGEVQCVGDDVYMWDGEKWGQLNAKVDSGISMTIYDLNEQLMFQLPDYSKDELNMSIDAINEFHNEVQSDYYMLLCKEGSYYTIFKKEENAEFDNLGAGVIECVQDLGSVRSVEKIDNTEVEIWVFNESTDIMFCLHLFDYKQGIVTFGG